MIFGMTNGMILGLPLQVFSVSVMEPPQVLWSVEKGKYGGVELSLSGLMVKIDSLNSYYYGGYLSNASVPDWNGRPRATSNLVRYKMDGNLWTKLAGPDDIRRAEGVMTFIPASDGGMLVYFGGVQDPDRNGTMIPQPMDQIFLYDIISNKWHVQKANGTTPEHRRKFCAGAVWSKDRSSYNMYNSPCALLLPLFSPSS